MEKLFILFTSASLLLADNDRNCTLLRTLEPGKNLDCFAEPECVEECGEVKGKNCKEHVGRQCWTKDEEECKIVEEEVLTN